MNPIRILIVDDHHVVRLGLIALVETTNDMKVVGQADDGQQAIAQFERLQPDIVLIDSRMPVMEGTPAIVEMLKINPQARILMLTAYDGDDEIRSALNAGALGYILKQSAGEDLLPALHSVAAGKSWIPPEIKKRLSSTKLLEKLTTREIEVLTKIASGLPNKQIADELGITLHTTKDHVKRILSKLQVADRTEAVSVAVQRGIIHL